MSPRSRRGAPVALAAQVLDAFDDLTPWRAVSSDEVSASVTPAKSPDASRCSLILTSRATPGTPSLIAAAGPAREFLNRSAAARRCECE